MNSTLIKVNVAGKTEASSAKYATIVENNLSLYFGRRELYWRDTGEEKVRLKELRNKSGVRRRGGCVIAGWGIPT
jgi:hypothetical protein